MRAWIRTNDTALTPLCSRSKKPSRNLSSRLAIEPIPKRIRSRRSLSPSRASDGDLEDADAAGSLPAKWCRFSERSQILIRS
jgi:hypothetical protein